MSPSHTRSRPRIVVVGGGFAGLWTVRALRKVPVDVLLIDRHNHHTFQPMLYQIEARLARRAMPAFQHVHHGLLATIGRIVTKENPG